MNASMSSSIEEKLRMAFRLFDKDKSGAISVKEMVEVIGTLYSVEGHKEVRNRNNQLNSFFLLQSEASERAEMLFSQLDRDLDGEITEEEFLRGCQADDDLLGLLRTMQEKSTHLSSVYLFAILRKGIRQNQRISVRDIMLLPRQRPSSPPMLLIRLILRKIFVK